MNANPTVSTLTLTVLGASLWLALPGTPANAAAAGSSKYAKDVAKASSAWSAGRLPDAEKDAAERYKKSAREEAPKDKKGRDGQASSAVGGGTAGTNGAATAAAATPRNRNKDFLPDGLEYGTILFTEGSVAKSLEVFEAVDDQLSRFELQAKTQLGNELLSWLASDASTTYRGRASDGIMLCAYKTLVSLQTSNVANARVELNHAVVRQKDAVELNRRRIEAAKTKVEDSQKADAAVEGDSVKGQMQQSYSYLDTLKVYADYENPFAVYLDALFFMAHYTGPEDVERSRKSFERVGQFAPENEFVKQDLAAMAASTRGTNIPPTTFVIFETGSALSFEERKISVPSPIGGAVITAFPVPVPNEDYVKGLEITSEGKKVATQLLASMDSVIGLEFKKDLPGIIRRTIMGGFAKAGMREGIKRIPLFGGAASLLTEAWNNADCRSWYTLPKEIQLCRITTPADRKLEIKSANGGAAVSLTVDPGYFNIVRVRSASGKAPLTIQQITLK